MTSINYNLPYHITIPHTQQTLVYTKVCCPAEYNVYWIGILHTQNSFLTNVPFMWSEAWSEMQPFETKDKNPAKSCACNKYSMWHQQFCEILMPHQCDQTTLRILTISSRKDLYLQTWNTKYNVLLKFLTNICKSEQEDHKSAGVRWQPWSFISQLKMLTLRIHDY